MPWPGWKVCQGSPKYVPKLRELKEEPQAWAGWKDFQSNKKRSLEIVCCSVRTKLEKVTG